MSTTPNLTEAQEHSMVCKWLKIQYPKVMFNTDMSGIKLSIGMAIKAATLRSHRGMPDLFIIEPRGQYAGLFIELKRTGEKLTKKNGDPVSDHIQEQMKIKSLLIERGYMAEIAIGYEQAMRIINNYLSIN